MAYTVNTPLANQLISQSQPLIQANFAALVSFGNGYAEFTEQVSVPSFGASNSGLYLYSSLVTSTNELYVRSPRPASSWESVPMTSSCMSNTATASCVNGWSYLPSGLLIKWGTIAAPSNPTSVTPTVTSGGPNFTKVFTVYVTPQDTSTNTNFACGQKTAANDTSGNFDAYCANPSATTYIKYLVIGV